MLLLQTRLDLTPAAMLGVEKQKTTRTGKEPRFPLVATVEGGHGLEQVGEESKTL